VAGERSDPTHMTRRWALVSRVLVASAAVSALVLAESPVGRTAGPVSMPVHTLTAVGPAMDTNEVRRAPSASGAPEKPPGYLLVRIERDMPVTARPGGGRTVGTMPSSSKYYHVPTVAWILERSPNGRYGKVALPYSGTRRTGWIPLKGLRRSRTTVMVRADISRHRITVHRGDRVLMRFPAATGARWSPTPTGMFFVTDRVPFSGGYLGSYAFGISGIQTRLPAGWSGGNQLAIHGTNDPGSIGRSASAGCLRVSERTLARLKPLLQLGTPVVIVP
jgi:lipoprotein-anchoring transpeptidase ErfK/SrfK